MLIEEYTEKDGWTSVSRPQTQEKLKNNSNFQKLSRTNMPPAVAPQPTIRAPVHGLAIPPAVAKRVPIVTLEARALRRLREMALG